MNDYIPHHWQGCTFWRDPETGNFEAYGFPLTDYTFRLWKLQELNTWLLDVSSPGADVFSISAHKLYCDWTFLELLSLAAVCLSQSLDVSILHELGHPELKLIISRATLWSQSPPEWLDSIEPKISSGEI
jgi:hypothetical protein